VSERVRSLLVVGRDAPAWLAACAIQRALGPTGLKVRVIELPSALAEADVYSAVPSLASMHRLLGFEERLVLGVCQGVPMVAQRFSNWGKSAPPFLLAYDDEPPPGGDLPFIQYWVKGALEGLRVGLEDFSLGSACARLGRVPKDEGESGVPLSASYGYHLDARSYAELVKQVALRTGVEIAGAGITDVAVAGDRIVAIETRGGGRVAADLFIDASGAERALINRLPGVEFESWRAHFPCDRMIACNGPRLKTLPVFSQVSAFRGGWVGLFPLDDRTAAVAAYDSSIVGDDELAQQLSVLARMPITGDAVVSPLNHGMLKAPWIGNCVAIADAAVALEPLDALSLHMAHACISHLLTVFPAAADEFPEALAYNRSIHAFAANVRDFQLAHYQLNRRFDDPLWDRARDAVVPASLQHKLDLFAARAMVPLYDEESFQEQSWAALFVGSGLMPEGYDLRIDAVPDAMHIETVQQRLRAVAELAKTMPSVDEFLGVYRPQAQVNA
jgi:tryptophan halogenase